jgi:DNA-binding NtrC family response regulator
VRIIASSNKSLQELVARGDFRQDLFYRLKVISVKMPSLQERPGDIPALAKHFLEQFGREFKKPVKQLSPEAAAVLRQYSWPGNVRELRNVIERLIILEAESVILPSHLPPEIRAGIKEVSRWVIQLPHKGVKLEDVERELVVQAVEQAGGNQTRAAELLGIERDALRRRLLKYGLLGAPAESSEGKC